MKTLLAITAVSLASAGYVVTINASSIREAQQEVTDLNLEKSKIVKSKDDKIKHLASQIAQKTIEAMIVKPLQEQNANQYASYKNPELHNFYGFSRFIPTLSTYFLKEISSENENELRFSIFKFNHGSEVITLTEENKESVLANSNKLYDLKYDLTTELIYAADDNQWKLPADHSSLSYSLPKTSINHPIISLDLNPSEIIFDDTAILQPQELTQPSVEQLEILKLKDLKIKELRKKLARTAIEAAIVKPLQDQANADPSLTFSRQISFPRQYFIEETESEHDSEVTFALYTKKGSHGGLKLFAGNQQEEPQNQSKLFDLKYDFKDEKIYALDKDQDQWKLTHEHPFLSHVNLSAIQVNLIQLQSSAGISPANFSTVLEEPAPIVNTVNENNHSASPDKK